MKKYIISFIITAVLFLSAFYLSNQFANTKIDEVRAIQDKISTDILSTETRFVLLGSSSCDHIESNPDFEAGLSNELSEMARRVKFMENQLGYNDERVKLIKDQYALLQIKDYLLRKQLSDKCKDKLPTILYFHGLDCESCKDQSIVLDEIHNRYPGIRIYWLDKDSSTPALDTLVSLFSITNTPSLVIDETKYENFQSLEVLSLILTERYPDLIDLEKDFDESEPTLNEEDKSQ